MGILDELLKKGKELAEKASEADGKDMTKQFLDAISETAGELNDALKKVDVSDLKDAFSSMLNEQGKNVRAPEERKTEEPVEIRTDYNYSDVSYAGIDKEDYYMELPEDSYDCKTKILEVLAKDFPNLEVREDVSPTTIGGTGRFMNYDLGIYANGTPKLFIMIIYGSKGRLREYRWSREQAERAGVAFINFIKDSPNRYWYISQRLRQYL